MYSTCIFCHTALGANEVVEHFPLGRRLAFDAARGRLWVVCARCSRWNLTPLEARWEAIEECERLFRGTRLRVSTENVGLARVREGLELVRIGAPQRPEFAAWRYGPQFARRYWRTVGMTAATGAVFQIPFTIAGHSLLESALPVVVGVSVMAQVPLIARDVLRARRRVANVAADQGDTMVVRGFYAGSAALSRSPDHDEMELRVFDGTRVTAVRGPELVPLLGRLLAWTNQAGAWKRSVRKSVLALEQHGGPEGFLESVSRRPNWRPADAFYRWQMRMKPTDANRWVANPPSIKTMPLVDRLALEMATNEESERVAMEGELRALEQAWRDAEEIAAIADDLLLPNGVRQLLARLKHGGAE